MPLTILPWRGGCEWRERALSHCLRRYVWPVAVAPGPTPWVKAAAVMPVIELAPDNEIVILADADVYCDLNAAVEAVETGAPWAIPHKGVHRLTREATETVLAGGDWRSQELEQNAYRGVEGGGIVVARRETLLEIPMDPRFVGWGQEDESHGAALRTLAGAPWRGKAPLVHLWHPAQERLTRERGSIDGWQLRRRYFTARSDPERMRQLVQEAKDALDAHQPAVHADPAQSR